MAIDKLTSVLGVQTVAPKVQKMKSENDSPPSQDFLEDFSKAEEKEKLSGPVSNALNRVINASREDLARAQLSQKTGLENFTKAQREKVEAFGSLLKETNKERESRDVQGRKQQGVLDAHSDAAQIIDQWMKGRDDRAIRGQAGAGLDDEVAREKELEQIEESRNAKNRQRTAALKDKESRRRKVVEQLRVDELRKDRKLERKEVDAHVFKAQQVKKENQAILENEFEKVKLFREQQVKNAEKVKQNADANKEAYLNAQDQNRRRELKRFKNRAQERVIENQRAFRKTLLNVQENRKEQKNIVKADIARRQDLEKRIEADIERRHVQLERVNKEIKARKEQDDFEVKVRERNRTLDNRVELSRQVRKKINLEEENAIYEKKDQEHEAFKSRIQKLELDRLEFENQKQNKEIQRRKSDRSKKIEDIEKREKRDAAIEIEIQRSGTRKEEVLSLREKSKAQKDRIAEQLAKIRTTNESIRSERAGSGASKNKDQKQKSSKTNTRERIEFNAAKNLEARADLKRKEKDKLLIQDQGSYEKWTQDEDENGFQLIKIRSSGGAVQTTVTPNDTPLSLTRIVEMKEAKEVALNLGDVNSKDQNS